MLFAPLIAFATDAPREIDLTVVLANYRGESIKDTTTAEPDDKDCSRCSPLTLGHAAAYALSTPFSDEAVTPEQKFARGALAMRVMNATTARLTAEEISVIKRCIGKAYPPMVIVRAFPLLDPNATAPTVQ